MEQVRASSDSRSLQDRLDTGVTPWAVGKAAVDGVRNVACRFQMIGEAFGDGKTLFIRVFPMFFDFGDSVTELRQQKLPAGGRGSMVTVPMGVHQHFHNSCQLLSDTIAAFLGHTIRVLNPNAFVDSRLIPNVICRDSQDSLNSMSAKDRKFALPELFRTQYDLKVLDEELKLAELFRTKENRELLDGELLVGANSTPHNPSATWAAIEAGWISKFVNWGTENDLKQGENAALHGFQVFFMEEVASRIAVFVTKILGIGLSVVCVAAGAVVLPLALLGVLGKNVSDAFIYSRNGGGNHEDAGNPYVKQVDEHRCYNVFRRATEILEDDESAEAAGIFAEENEIHLKFERAVACMTLFAIDNISQIGSLILGVHDLAIGLIRPKLLAPTPTLQVREKASKEGQNSRRAEMHIMHDDSQLSGMDGEGQLMSWGGGGVGS